MKLQVLLINFPSLPTPASAEQEKFKFKLFWADFNANNYLIKICRH